LPFPIPISRCPDPPIQFCQKAFGFLAKSQ
jgi:hypothetical protein